MKVPQWLKLWSSPIHLLRKGYHSAMAALWPALLVCGDMSQKTERGQASPLRTLPARLQYHCVEVVWLWEKGLFSVNFLLSPENSSHPSSPHTCGRRRQVRGRGKCKTEHCQQKMSYLLACHCPAVSTGCTRVCAASDTVTPPPPWPSDAGLPGTGRWQPHWAWAPRLSSSPPRLLHHLKIPSEKSDEPEKKPERKGTKRLWSANATG